MRRQNKAGRDGRQRSHPSRFERGSFGRLDQVARDCKLSIVCRHRLDYDRRRESVVREVRRGSMAAIPSVVVNHKRPSADLTAVGNGSSCGGNPGRPSVVSRNSLCIR